MSRKLGQHAGPTPGRRSRDGAARPGRSDAEPLGNQVVQRDRRAHETAERGFAGHGGTLPHREQLQRSFGAAHDLSTVQAYVGGAAAEASDQLAAKAYTDGERVAFAAAPDLATAAHEAAHVVQQRRGVALQGGVGREGDAHERNANAVAERVLQGRPAGDLLGTHVGACAPSGALQRTPAPKSATPAGPPNFDAILDAGKNVDDLDPRKDPNYIDNVIDEVSNMFIYADRYTLSWTVKGGGSIGIWATSVGWKDFHALPVFDINATEHEAALDAMSWAPAAWKLGYQSVYSFYRGPGGIIFPTLYSKESTPTIYKLIVEVNEGNLRTAGAVSKTFRDLRNGLLIGAGIGIIARGAIGFAGWAGAGFPSGGGTVDVPVGPRAAGASDPVASDPVGGPATTVAPAVLEATVNGVPQPPSGYGRLYHGTDAIPPPAALADGFAARGDNLDLQQYAEGARDTAFRGATELPANPVDEQGAAYWAGEGGYVYEIEGVPHWDVNQLLQGRVKTPGGYRGNLMSGEHDLAIPGRIPPENIRRWGKVLRTTTGKLYVGEWHDNPGFKPRP